MRLEKLRQVDLNLLIIFAVIAEEKSATKASSRLLLSQPAVSRALQRARSMFQDELVIRSSSGFELTLRGRKILQELEQLLPKIEGLVVPSVFDPKKERGHFRPGQCLHGAATAFVPDPQVLLLRVETGSAVRAISTQTSRS